jgi:hypothetical protein
MSSSSTSSRRNRLHDVPAGFALKRGRYQRESGKQSALELAWRRNWTLLVGLFSVGFISARLLTAASSDPETAYAILQATGTGSVVVGSLIPAIGLLVFPLLVIGASHGLSAERLTDRSLNALMMAAAVLAGVVTILTAPAIPLLVDIAFTLIIVAGAALFPRSTWEQRRHHIKDLLPSSYALITVYSVIAIVFTVIYSAPWLPTQNITMKGQQEFSAYILSQGNQTTSILTQNPTAVLQLPSNQIVMTQICKTPYYRSGEETIAEWLGISVNGNRVVSYPKCDGNYFNVKLK